MSPAPAVLRALAGVRETLDGTGRVVCAKCGHEFMSGYGDSCKLTEIEAHVCEESRAVARMP